MHQKYVSAPLRALPRVVISLLVNSRSGRHAPNTTQMNNVPARTGLCTRFRLTWNTEVLARAQSCDILRLFFHMYTLDIRIPEINDYDS